MITNKAELKEYLNYEIKKYNLGKGCILRALKYLYGTESGKIWYFQRRLRITEYHYNSNHKLRYILSLFLLNRIRNKYSIHIGLNVFDKGLKIMHLGPILINGNVRIGKDCSIHINTALVAQGVSDGVPTIGDNVVIGIGAIILGNIIIADGIAIGANALVNKSFTEPNIAIAGVPARKISNNGKLKWNKIREVNIPQ